MSGDGPDLEYDDSKIPLPATLDDVVVQLEDLVDLKRQEVRSMQIAVAVGIALGIVALGIMAIVYANLGLFP